MVPGGFQSALGRSIRAGAAGFAENDRPTKRALHRDAADRGRSHDLGQHDISEPRPVFHAEWKGAGCLLLRKPVGTAANAKSGGMPQGNACTFSGKTCIFCSRLALRKANSLAQLPKASTNFLALRLPHCPSSSGRRWRQPYTSSEIAKDMKAAYSERQDRRIR